MPVQLRPFQIELERKIYAAWNEILRQRVDANVMPVAATGSGKTVVIAKMHYDEPGYSAAVAHRQELVSQISTAFARNGVRHRLIGAKKGGALIRTISAIHMMELGANYFDPNAKVGVGGVDTIIRMDASDPFFQQCRLLTQDEAHHVLKKNKWGKLQGMFRNARGLLPTATACRADGCGLGRHADGLVDALVLAPAMREIIDMGYLTDYRIFAPRTQDLDLDAVPVGESGDFSGQRLREAVHKSRIVGDVVAHYVKHAMGKLGVTFAVDVEDAGNIAAAFRAAGVPAEVVSAKTPDAVRAQILRRFKNREILQLVNVDLFGEGFDLPAVQVVSMARPTMSFALFAQQFGRGLRLMLTKEIAGQWDNMSPEQRKAWIASSEKPHALIFDHVGNVERHGLPDAAREWSLDRREKRSASKSDAIPLRVCLNEMCLQPYERVHKCCPYCGHYTPPAARSGPEFVDGDLTELDPATLAAKRGEIARIDAPFHGPGMPWTTQVHARRGHMERQHAQAGLRNSIAWWAGLQSKLGRGESEAYRRFWHQYGVDVASAQTLGTREAAELQARVDQELAKYGINPAADPVAAFSVEH